MRTTAALKLVNVKFEAAPVHTRRVRHCEIVRHCEVVRVPAGVGHCDVVPLRQAVRHCEVVARTRPIT